MLTKKQQKPKDFNCRYQFEFREKFFPVSTVVINLICLYEDNRPAKNFRELQCCIAQAHTSVANENAQSAENENAKLFTIFPE